MGKLVVLELDGDLECQGFQVKLEIGWEGERPELKSLGELPCEPTLYKRVEQHWIDHYRPLGAPSARKLRPREISYDGSVNAKKACEDSAKTVRELFNQWLSSASFRKLDGNIRENLNYGDRIRFTIRTSCEDLQKLPWHTWELFEQYANAEITFSSPQFQQSAGLSSTPAGKVRILAILGHSEGIDTEKDRQTLKQLPQAEVMFLTEPKRSEINDKLWEQPWDILFFAGHSETEGETGKIYINEDEYLTLDQIWYGLRKAVDRGLKLAIFNSCDGLGLARRLDETQIPQMIVMRDLVPDRVAQEFLKSFLVNFSLGKSFEVAVREARERLQGLEDDIPCATWLPVVWQHPDCISTSWDDLAGRSTNSVKLFNPPNRVWISAIALFTSFGLMTQFWVRPKVSIYLSTIGVEYLNRDRYRRGMEYLQWSIMFNSNQSMDISKTLNNIGAKYLQEQRYNLAIKYLKKTIEINPEQSSAMVNLGFIYEVLQADDLALQMYRQAKKLGNPRGCKGEALIYNKRRQFDKALNLLRICLGQMIATDRILGEYLVRKDLAFALLKRDGSDSLKQEDYEEAEALLRIAIDLKPKEGVANCVLAQVLEAQDEVEQALNQWDLCVQFGQSELPQEADWIQRGKMKLKQNR